MPLKHHIRSEILHLTPLFLFIGIRCQVKFSFQKNNKKFFGEKILIEILLWFSRVVAASLYVLFTWFPHGTNCKVFIGPDTCSQREGHCWYPIIRGFTRDVACYRQWGIMGSVGSLNKMWLQLNWSRIWHLTQLSVSWFDRTAWDTPSLVRHYQKFGNALTYKKEIRTVFHLILICVLLPYKSCHVWRSVLIQVTKVTVIGPVYVLSVSRTLVRTEQYISFSLCFSSPECEHGYASAYPATQIAHQQKQRKFKNRKLDNIHNRWANPKSNLTDGNVITFNCHAAVLAQS